MISADYRERLRRLALHDDDLVGSMLATHPGRVEASTLDPMAVALVALDAPCTCYQSGIEWALAAGATADEIVGTLMAVAPATGVARVVAAAPEFALALGYDLDAAFEAWDDDPG